MRKGKLTYEDFEIGQKVICVKHDPFDGQHLTVGKTYIVEDTDFHFPDAICVKSDNGRISMFFKIEHFDDVNLIRKLKLEKINKS